jgi:hypothetical protein
MQNFSGKPQQKHNNSSPSQNLNQRKTVVSKFVIKSAKGMKNMKN